MYGLEGLIEGNVLLDHGQLLLDVLILVIHVIDLFVNLHMRGPELIVDIGCAFLDLRDSFVLNNVL